MSDREHPGTTTVTPDYGGADGEVELRFGRSSPFGEAEMPFAGDGVLVFDPAAPDRLLALSTRAPAAAGTTMAEAIGAPAAEELTQWHLGGSRPGQLQVQPGRGLSTMARLALASWLEQWSPLDIPRGAAVADVGSAAYAAMNPLLAIRSFDRSAAFLVALAENGLASDTVPVVIRDGIAETLRAASASLRTGHVLSDRITGLLQRYQDAQDRAHADLTARLSELLDADLLTTAAPAPAPGHRLDTPNPEDVFSIDWALVPARVFRTVDGQALISRTDAGITITVDPARWLDHAETFGLRVRLLDPATGNPIASAPLTWDPQLTKFTGRFPYDLWRGTVTPEALASGLPEVYTELLDGTQPRPRIGDARTSAQAWRRAVWALTWHRRAHAAALVFGRTPDADRIVQVEEDRAAGEARAAARLLKTLGDPGAQSRAAVLVWRGTIAGQADAAADSAAWPTGLLVPEAAGVDRPLLSELIDVAAPDLWPA